MNCKPAAQPRYDRRLRDLCRDGHRGSATVEEKRAAEHLLGELREMGLSPTAEPFLGCQSAAMRYLIHLGVAVVGMAFLWTLPLVTCVIVLLSLVSLVAEQTTRGVWLSRPCVRSPSQNVTATIASTTPTVARLVLCAHYDTQRTGRIWKISRRLAPVFWRAPAVLQPPLSLLGFTLAAQIVLGVVAAFHEAGTLVTVGAATTLVSLAAFAWLFWDWHRSPAVPGAADNASGVADVLALAEAWQREPIAGVELIVLLSGCEETGMLGAAAWLDRHGDVLKDKPLAFLNLDSLAFGPFRFLAHDTPTCGLPMRYPEPFLTLAQSVAARRGCQNSRVEALPGPTDGLAFLTRGIQGITVFGCRDGGEFPNYHTVRDVPENIDPAVAWEVVESAWEILRALGLKLIEDGKAVGSRAA